MINFVVQIPCDLLILLVPPYILVGYRLNHVKPIKPPYQTVLFASKELPSCGPVAPHSSSAIRPDPDGLTVAIDG